MKRRVVVLFSTIYALIFAGFLAILFVDPSSAEKKQKKLKKIEFDFIPHVNDSIWVSVYQGIVPCPNRDELKVRLTLLWSLDSEMENKYILEEMHSGKDTVRSSGHFHVEQAIRGDKTIYKFSLNYDMPRYAQKQFYYFKKNPNELFEIVPYESVLEDSGKKYVLRLME